MDKLISLQAVLETLDDMDNVLDEDRTIKNYKELLKECYEVLPHVKPQELKYCDRNICLRNEYNNIGCDECEVTKSQEPSGDLINRQAVMDCFKKWQPYMATRLWDFEQELSKLPSVSPQPCEDAISRQAVHEAITRWAGSMSVLIALPTREVRPLLESIHKLPSVKPQEKTGHWKLQPSNKEQGERDFIWWKCSKCGQVIFSETEKDRREYHAFCGRCGAKMVDEQERSDKE